MTIGLMLFKWYHWIQYYVQLINTRLSTLPYQTAHMPFGSYIAKSHRVGTNTAIFTTQFYLALHVIGS